MENTKPWMKNWYLSRHQNVQCDSKQHQRQVSVGN